MNVNIFNVFLLLLGVILMYAARKNEDPRDVVLMALNQKPRFRTSSTPPSEGPTVISTWTSV